jgi:dTDP-4-dehydrorhamnose reductase
MAWDRSQVDITDPIAVQNALANYDTEVVFSAAAYGEVDVAEQEPQAAYLVNALAVRNLAVACRQVDAQLVHFSTDYVFDGTARHPYIEEDLPHPLGAYAVSKLAGELYAQAYLDRALVVRTSGVFGPGGLATARGNFVELMLRLGASANPIRVVEDQVPPHLPPAPRARTIDLWWSGTSPVSSIGGGAHDVVVSVRGSSERPASILLATNEREYHPARRPKYSALSNAKMGARAWPPPLSQVLVTYFAERPAANVEKVKFGRRLIRQPSSWKRRQLAQSAGVKSSRIGAIAKRGEAEHAERGQGLFAEELSRMNLGRKPILVSHSRIPGMAR